LRWLQADLIDEIEPLTDDARFNIDTALGQISGEASSGKPNTIREETRKSEALMTLNAQANLIVGLFGRLGTVQTQEDMEQTGHVIGEAVDQLEVEAKALARWPDTVTVRQIRPRPERRHPRCRNPPHGAVIDHPATGQSKIVEPLQFLGRARRKTFGSREFARVAFPSAGKTQIGNT